MKSIVSRQQDLIPFPIPFQYEEPIGPKWNPALPRTGIPQTGDAVPNLSPAPQAVPQPVPAPPNQPSREEPKPKTKKENAPSAPAVSAKNSERKLTIAELTKKYPGIFMLKSPVSAPKAALTFDDAPDDKYTPQVLDILKKYHVKATFFIVGSRAEKHPQLVKRMVREGHVIGNHSYDHALLPKLPDEKYKSQIRKTDAIIKRLTGYSPRFLRPPYGEISESQLKWAAAERMLVVNWNVDSQDWRQLNAQQVTYNVMKDARAGAIILQHSGGGDGQDLSGTVQALPGIIEQLRAKGLELVTLPELLHESKQK
ncbi:polysaccharide deacetylase family protein [Paenibacillus hamazuiensis]|uniref:polysaccharide deacetylase family protein n=1 Tax=Paenibacillus hamazuiensis TaxID=2936508 RepID=UPI00200CD5C6|nr:polysaccharide deacetylase family protein [Paenibacillus hamazuiensis]